MLLPVLIDEVRAPLGFQQFNVADLIGWDGQPGHPKLDTLLRLVAEVVNRREAFLWPVDFNLVTGARDRHPDLGPTVNMMCRLTNGLSHPIVLSRLELKATRDGAPAFDLVQSLFYAARGGEHTQVQRDNPITIGPGSKWESGVQFRDIRTEIPNAWPTGQYEFELIGWVLMPDTRTLKTTFRADVEQYVEFQMTRWRNASAKEWTESRTSDRAMGFSLQMTDIKVRLPTTGNSPDP